MKSLRFIADALNKDWLSICPRDRRVTEISSSSWIMRSQFTELIAASNFNRCTAFVWANSSLAKNKTTANGIILVNQTGVIHLYITNASTSEKICNWTSFSIPKFRGLKPRIVHIFSLPSYLLEFLFLSNNCIPISTTFTQFLQQQLCLHCVGR